MQRPLHRIVALLLVPCLLTDPSIVSACTTGLSPARERVGMSGEVSPTLFNQEALALSGAARLLGRKTFTRVATIALALLVASSVGFAPRSSAASNPTQALFKSQMDKTTPSARILANQLR